MRIISALCYVMSALYCVPILVLLNLLIHVALHGGSAGVICMTALIIVFLLLVIYLQLRLADAVRRPDGARTATLCLALATPYLLGEAALPVLVLVRGICPDVYSLAFAIASGLHATMAFVALVLLLAS
jgi:hypothetical protein